MTFYGYKRPDGRVGVRNHVLVLPASICAWDTTRIVTSQVNGAVTFNNQNGCAQVGADQQFTMDVMAGFAANSNVYGTVVVSLGCENCQMDLVLKAIQERTNKPLKQVIIQEAGGTLKAIEQAVRYAKEMVAEATALRREEFPISELIIGTECGGSDPTSGLAANPLIGQLSDLLVKNNATSVLSKTTEFIGGEHLLAARAVNKEVHDRIYDIVERYEKSLQLVVEEVREGNPSPGNKAGGLTTLEEKSLGCIHKGGHTPINAVYDYAKQLNKEEGLVIMDTPVVTVFHEDGTLDVEGNKAVYEHLIAGGVDGIVVMDSSGEFFTMSTEQKKQLIRIAAETIQNRVRLLVGTSCMGYRDTIELSNYAIDQGADGVMVVSPYYFALSDASVEEYFDKVADGVHGDILLYNFPDCTGYDIKPEVTLNLSRRHKNIVGFKDTVVAMDHTHELIKTMRPEFPEFEILSGFNDNFTRNVMSGGNGSIGGLSNLIPEVTSALTKAMREKDFDAAMKYQREIDQWMDIYSIATPFIPVVKRAMQLRGIPMEATCTAPFLPLNEKQDAKLKALMTRMGVL